MPALGDDSEKALDATYSVEDLPIDTPDRTHGDLERKLVRKLDLRMSIIVVIYTLNLVSLSRVSVCQLVECTNCTFIQIDRANVTCVVCCHTCFDLMTSTAMLGCKALSRTCTFTVKSML